MDEFKYTINDIFKFPVGTKLQDEEGNTYKIFQDKLGSKTFKYSILNERLMNSKFKVVDYNDVEDKNLICHNCGIELGRGFVKIDDHGGYDFILGVEYDCECGYYRVDK